MDKRTGICGDGVVWSFEDGRLTVSGAGRMSDFTDYESTPFSAFRAEVREVVIADGVENIGNYAFSHFPEIEEVTVPGSARYIGCGAFGSCAKLARVTLGEGVEVISPKAFEKNPALTEMELPSTLRAVDFKALKASDNLCEVKYGGTKTQWQRGVRIGRSSHGNAALSTAHFSYRDTTRKYDRMTARLGDIVRRGGDGSMYVITPDLSVEDFDGKSGDCTLIVFPDGETMMIDAGAPPCGYHVVELLRGMGLSKLDHFVLSHPHVDHHGGAPEAARYLFEQGGGIGMYIYSGFEFKTAEGKLAKLLEEHGTVMRRDVTEGCTFDIGGVHIDILNPTVADLHVTSETDLSDGGVNNVSLAMKFTFGKVSYLTAGDLYAVRERELAKKYGAALHADAAKTDHHGLFTSNTDEWLAAVSPRVLVSDSDDAPWTVFSEKLERMEIPHYIVSDCGLCVMRLGGDGNISVETEYPIGKGE